MPPSSPWKIVIMPLLSVYLYYYHIIIYYNPQRNNNFWLSNWKANVGLTPLPKARERCCDRSSTELFNYIHYFDHCSFCIMYIIRWNIIIYTFVEQRFIFHTNAAMCTTVHVAFTLYLYNITYNLQHYIIYIPIMNL